DGNAGRHRWGRGPCCLPVMATCSGAIGQADRPDAVRAFSRARDLDRLAARPLAVGALERGAQMRCCDNAAPGMTGWRVLARRLSNLAALAFVAAAVVFAVVAPAPARAPSHAVAAHAPRGYGTAPQPPAPPAGARDAPAPGP